MDIVLPENPMAAVLIDPTSTDTKIKIQSDNVCFKYGTFEALHNISMQVPERRITALIGPSGCGKSTFLRCLNRMNDLIDGTSITGTVSVDGEDIYSKAVDPVALRKKIGMVFQKPNPFPMSIFDNIAYGPRIHGVRNRAKLEEVVERCLMQAYLWSEVKDKLNESAFMLSGGQQQRLCIARTMAVDPEIILMDEPCSALDPIATRRIEDLMLELRNNYTIVIVTHNLQQAQRASDHTGFFMLGRLVEFDTTAKLFQDPEEQETNDYITGRFG